MLIGAMNNPAFDLLPQIEWMGGAGLDFLDLTLEAPGAASWKLNTQEVRQTLSRYGLAVVGHTAPYLPLASPVEELRQAALVEFRRCLKVFQSLGARWMNLHPRTSPMHQRPFSISRNLESLRELLPSAQERGIGLMIENIPGDFNTVAQLSELLDPLPELGLHLDVGHTNLMTPCNTEPEILSAYAPRLRHVHLHDNRGGHMDLHLPIGAGNIDMFTTIGALKSSGYDGTITLEVFASDPNHLLYSRDVLKRIWDGTGVGS